MVIVSKTKTELVYNDLKKKILSCELKPEARLVIRQLAQEYGSSDIPVREALKELTAEGLVETVPHKGSTVVGISIKNIQDMLQMREYLEPIAASLAAQNSTPAVIKELKKAYENTIKIAASGDMQAYSLANRAFHDIIIKNCGNTYLQNMLHELINIDKRTCMIFQIYSKTIEKSKVEHLEMIKLMEDKDSQKLAELTRIHKNRAFQKIKKYFKLD